ncbi:phosphate ABC transporter permease subunit PstC [Methanolobus profundi]|uniref:Phosphate transport system permease protein n=1 Tax=Methanolobus profundi TaxID=487685 RepID=A0A1I4PD62_9EURY|nr:phosphate ABC transporter permease subunit PstC [Methanolobus profundi]SFM25476.1 phosphate ABC transporter membrane protein 1, PhoT family [Methanolobus profundi]
MNDKRRLLQIINLAFISSAVFATFFGSNAQESNKRALYNRSANLIFFVCTIVVAFIVIFFIGFIFYTALPVFQSQGLINFIITDEWNYGKNIYGIRTFIAGTVIMTVVTLIMAVPISIFTAIFLSEIASPRLASTIRPFIELLVGIPSVVYGIFGLFVLENIFQNHIEPVLASLLGFIPIFVDVNPQSGLGVLLASTVLAIMVFPTITTISENAIRSVSVENRHASLSLGANRWETIRNVVLPAASSGIMTAVVLGMMRAMGETMAIVMLLGNSKTIPSSVMGPGYAMTSKILNDIGHHFSEEGPRAALFGIAAVLFAIEIGFVAVSRYLGGRK